MDFELQSYRDGVNSDDEKFMLRRELAGLQEENQTKQLEIEELRDELNCEKEKSERWMLKLQEEVENNAKVVNKLQEKINQLETNQSNPADQALIKEKVKHINDLQT